MPPPPLVWKIVTMASREEYIKYDYRPTCLFSEIVASYQGVVADKNCHF